jgi:hypothetical protein
MADATAGIFPTTLLLLYFTTPAANVPVSETKEMQEKKAIWTFQSSSQISLPDVDICTSTALQMMDEIKPVRTMTVRAYCLCPHGVEIKGDAKAKLGAKAKGNVESDESQKCFSGSEQAEAHITANKLQERAVARPFVKAIGPKTVDPFPR